MKNTFIKNLAVTCLNDNFENIWREIDMHAIVYLLHQINMVIEIGEKVNLIWGCQEPLWFHPGKSTIMDTWKSTWNKS